jgi:alginate O-acetyltransferase complex protein AlgI
MAIGLGQMFGFNFPENFNYPYISKNITEFWRRWHITLSSWFREYVYIPLGGNRKGKLRQIINLFVVWALTGLWHGASWNFVIWGIYFFILLMIEKLVLLDFLKKIPGIFSRIYSLFFIIIGWVIFACTPIEGSGAFGNLLIYLKSMFSGNLINDTFLYLFRTNFILICIMCFASTPILKIITGYLKQKFNPSEGIKFAVKATCCMLIFFLSISYLTGDSYNPFLYTRF